MLFPRFDQVFSEKRLAAGGLLGAWCPRPLANSSRYGEEPQKGREVGYFVQFVGNCRGSES